VEAGDDLLSRIASLVEAHRVLCRRLERDRLLAELATEGRDPGLDLEHRPRLDASGLGPRREQRVADVRDRRHGHP
jgi:hypothetical protein